MVNGAIDLININPTHVGMNRFHYDGNTLVLN